MGYSLRIETAESQNPGANQSTVAANLYLDTTFGSSWFGTSISGNINIGGNVSTFSRSSGGSSSGSSSTLIHSHSVTFTHNAQGERGAVGTSGAFGPGSNVPSLSVGGTTYGGINYSLAPAAPSTVSVTLNTGKSITVESNAVSSPAGTPTYYVAYQSSSDNGATWGAWSSYLTIPSNARSYTYAFGALPPGLTYRFRMYASNVDGDSPATVSASSVFLPAGGKRWNGSAWVVTTTAKRWTGSVWTDVQVAKRWNGSAWVDLS